MDRDNFPMNNPYASYNPYGVPVQQQQPVMPVGMEPQYSENTFYRSAETHAPKPPAGRRIMGGIFDALFYLLIFSLVTGATMFAFSNDETKSLFGYRFYTVLSNSMQPEFAKGDMIIVELTDEIREGDIITFNPGSSAGAYLTHRVVGFADNRGGIPGQYVITRGDTNNTDDPPTPIENVIGREIFHIPYMGTVIKFVQENFVPMIIAVVAGFFLIIVMKSLISKDGAATPEERKRRSSARV